jgi:hypothetical protein
MSFMPMVSAFCLALIGAVAVGLRPGYSFGMLMLGATISAAMAGLAASVAQFLPRRYYFVAIVIGGCVMGLVVGGMLRAARVLEFGAVRDATALIWPVAIVTALVLSRNWGMHLPRLRRRRA